MDYQINDGSLVRSNKRRFEDENEFEENCDNHYYKLPKTNENHKGFQLNFTLENQLNLITNQLAHSKIDFHDLENWSLGKIIKRELPSIDNINAQTVKHYNAVFPPEIGNEFFGYKITHCLKMDSKYGVYRAYNEFRGEQFVIKLGIDIEKLKFELDTYQKIGMRNDFPKFIDSFWWQVREPDISFDENYDNLNYKTVNWLMIVIEEKGIDLYLLIKNHFKSGLDVPIFMYLAPKMISSIQYLHSLKIVHRGVKPDNFIFDKVNNFENIYLIDFGKSALYNKNIDGKHVVHVEFEQMDKYGNPIYHSVNYRKGISRTRRDDMILLGYCFIYMLKGCLPWTKKWTKRTSKKDGLEKVYLAKQSITIESLCKGLPQALVGYFKMCAHLDYDSEPNYKQMQDLFK